MVCSPAPTQALNSSSRNPFPLSFQLETHAKNAVRSIAAAVLILFMVGGMAAAQEHLKRPPQFVLDLSKGLPE